MDTGSRGRRGKGKASKGEKRKREDEGLEEEANVKRTRKDTEGNEDTAMTPNSQGTTPTPKAAVTASTGFIHILPPTPESWTTSLPHRTQVVYTPDYSYILHRLRARPGSIIIEAGAGSGSFTHAAARAVFNGYPSRTEPTDPSIPHQQHGKVWSFEFHEQRVSALRTEIHDHGLSPLVQITHRDVCASGFQPPGSLLNATSIFLDLPAPWLALKHLTRSPTKPHPPSHPRTPAPTAPPPEPQPQPDDEFRSPLNPLSAIHICTFSPCIEQVQRTISTLRHLGWLSIQMVEIAARRIETRRERIGLGEEGLRGVNASPASVEEAVTRLREVEGRSKGFYGGGEGETLRRTGDVGTGVVGVAVSKQQRLERIRAGLAGRKVWKEGRLVGRAEPELKTHTSYLVFAVLPREWTEGDEEGAMERWSVRGGGGVEGGGGNVSRRQMKKAAKGRGGGNKGEVERAEVGGAGVGIEV